MFFFALLILLFSGCAKDSEEHPFAWNNDILKAFYSDSNSFDDAFLHLQENGLDYTHYHVWAGRIIFDLVLNREFCSDIEDALNRLMDTYRRHGSFPRPEFGALEFGWTTSMDAPTIGVAMILAYEITGDEKYKDFLEDLIPFLLKEAKDGGYIIYADGKRWLLEYAWQNVTEEDAWFVLNGSMYGACATAYIAAYLENEELRDLVLEQLLLYEEKISLYKNNERNWYYYQLNPLVINQAIKPYIEDACFGSLIELMRLDFFNEVVDEEFFKWVAVELDDRRRTFGILKPIYAIEAEDNMLDFTWLRHQAPHPYMIDLKNVDIEFYNEKDELIYRMDDVLSNNIYENGAYTGTVSSEAKYVKYFTGASGIRRHQIGQGEIILLSQHETTLPSPLTFDFSADDDFTLSDEGYLILNSETSDALWGSVWANMTDTKKLSISQYYTIEIENFSDKAIFLGIMIYDSKGIGAFRSLPEILPGKNLQIFNIAGFMETNEILDDMEKMQLRFYTNQEDLHDIKIMLSDIRCFENTISLHDYIIRTEYMINQK